MQRPIKKVAVMDDRVRERVRRLVAVRDVTQTELGEAAGHHQAWAQRYLAGTLNAGLDELFAMARLLDVDVAELLSDEAKA